MLWLMWLFETLQLMGIAALVGAALGIWRAIYLAIAERRRRREAAEWFALLLSARSSAPPPESAIRSFFRPSAYLDDE